LIRPAGLVDDKEEVASARIAFTISAKEAGAASSHGRRGDLGCCQYAEQRMGKNGKPFTRWAFEFQDGRKISTATRR
jgi:hypothetical protein